MKKNKKKESIINPFFGWQITLILILFKLINVLDWSWFWVLSPTIIPLVFFIILGLIAWIMLSKKDKAKILKQARKKVSKK